MVNKNKHFSSVNGGLPVHTRHAKMYMNQFNNNKRGWGEGESERKKERKKEGKKQREDK